MSGWDDFDDDETAPFRPRVEPSTASESSSAQNDDLTVAFRDDFADDVTTAFQPGATAEAPASPVAQPSALAVPIQTPSVPAPPMAPDSPVGLPLESVDADPARQADPANRLSPMGSGEVRDLLREPPPSVRAWSPPPRPNAPEPNPLVERTSVGSRLVTALVIAGVGIGLAIAILIILRARGDLDSIGVLTPSLPEVDV